MEAAARQRAEDKRLSRLAKGGRQALGRHPLPEPRTGHGAAKSSQRAPLPPAPSPARPGPHPLAETQPGPDLPSPAQPDPARLTTPLSLPLHQPPAGTRGAGWETHTPGTIASHCPPSPYTQQPNVAPSASPAAMGGGLPAGSHLTAALPNTRPLSEDGDARNCLSGAHCSHPERF